MHRTRIAGVLFGGLALVGGLALQLGTAGSAPIRMWNVVRSFGVVLPAPEFPLLADLTLLLLNLPVWSVLATFGLLIVGASLLPARSPRRKGGSMRSQSAGPPLYLNGILVDPRLATLMRRSDWAGKRTSATWRGRFPGDPEATYAPEIDLLSVDALVRENAHLRDPEAAILHGEPNAASPPGDFDPKAGYLIGMTHTVDCGIFVDLRGGAGGRIIYDNVADRGASHVIAFDSIQAFVDFYLEQHGLTEPTS